MLQVRTVSKQYGQTLALSKVSFNMQDGETLAILGPSGCGKSTLLRVLAGLEHPDQGDVLWDDQEITHLPPEKRLFSLVFQDYALFPHLNVLANVMFGLIERKTPRKQAGQVALDWLEKVNLQGLERRRVTELSGGQQQRVAVARALAVNPRLLLLDEPFSNLDQQLREEVQNELLATLRETRSSTILVTHDQQEAFKLASRVIVMREGKIEQVGTPSDLYHHPESRWVANFLGHDNVFDDFFIPQYAFKLDATEKAARVLSIERLGREIAAQVDLQNTQYTIHFSEREAFDWQIRAGSSLPLRIDRQLVQRFRP
ncbi:ABC transporter ATP-binding protein [Deinococcus cellulosilyticus]|uniref:ABC transporter ATP-binding protein n=1 Tax=Deinococcus cellulosilyticus (strain DSM 18568 / NBRC 106333 / KACC 11606 / 5516J-15) TaxID=1223518 RepID=A0A511N5H7_DEIC1|nr:ABC transporter ATP-binding protein [Deinococcus cellulosilyticus]GEM47676.1 ABC transporter ATP-binding protein [Deinococcus cellulosilyticus NBRC 106333 = KACC 11606]